MSGSATVRVSPSKRSRRSNDNGSAAVGGSAANGSAVGGGSAATPDAAGNTKKVATVSPLSAALVLKVTFIESLPIASRPFLTPLAESALREFACLFYAEEKVKETKSNPNYVSSSAKKLGIVLQAMPEVQASQGFKALRNNLTADLEKFQEMITQEYVLKANDLNVEAKRTRYYTAICKWIRGLAQAFIAQQNIYNYNEDVAVLDLIAGNQDDILVSLGIPLPKFLAAYKAAHNLQGIPTPTIDFNFQDELDRINGTPPLEEEAAPPATAAAAAPAVANANQEALVIIINNDLAGSQDDEEEEQEMIDATNAVETAAIGGRLAVCRLIYEAIYKGTVEPIRKFHLQRNENEETKRIKAAFTLPRLNEAAQRVAAVIANEPPAQMPVLRGLVNETATKATAAMERRIKSLEDQLKSATGKTPTGAKKVKGDGKKLPQSILKKKGNLAAKKTTALRDAQDENNKGTARAKGKKKPKERRVSFDGKKAAKRTNSRK